MPCSAKKEKAEVKKSEAIRLKNTMVTDTTALNTSQAHLHDLVSACSALEAGCTSTAHQLDSMQAACSCIALRLILCLRAALEGKPRWCEAPPQGLVDCLSCGLM